MRVSCYSDLNAEVVVADDSTVSKTLHQDERIKVVLFGFAAGQELSEHTASVPAIVHVLEGTARLTLGGEVMSTQAGSWVHMPANLPHSVLARTPVKMLLTLLRDA